MDINVVMMVYNRPEYFKDVIKSLEEQTAKFKLHVISNNPQLNTVFKEVIEQSSLDINFCESDNKRMTAERWFYVKENLMYTEYVIFIDDDMILNTDTIQKIWDSREKNTMKIFQGRKFYTSEDSITHGMCAVPVKSHDEFSYGCLNLGIVDTVYWKEPSLLFEMAEKYPELCYKADDMVVSWVVNKLGGRILNHGQQPKVNLSGDMKAFSRTIQSQLANFYKPFEDMYKFKRFDR